MLDFVFWLLKKLIEYFSPDLAEKLRRRRDPELSTAALGKINQHVEGLAIVSGPYAHEPVLEVLPGQAPAEAIGAAVEARRAELGSTAPNDPHALVVNEVAWEDDPLQFCLRPIDYAELCVLRDTVGGGQRPWVLSGNALIVCPEKRTLILHKRSATSATYPGCLHTIGGGYWPPGLDGRDGDGKSLRHTVVREVYEETRIHVSIRDETPVLALQEVRTGFVQMAFLGCVVDKDACARIENNKEGHAVWVKFDDLERRLKEDAHWVPTAKASVLAWLAMAAPCAGARPRFAGKRATEVFDAVVGHASKRGGWLSRLLE